MTLPVRVGVRVTLSALHTTLSAAARAMTLAGDALQSVTGHDDHPYPAPSRSAEAAVAESRPASPSPPPVAEPIRAPAAAPEPEPKAELEPEPRAELEPEPAHVSEGLELVAEIAEPGAEDGAGASVTVDEPWQGFALLNAKDIVDRLARAGLAELAAIQLYESTHKQRETVLSAVTRELRKQSPGAHPDQSNGPRST
ncbi:MAG: hypothetical protein ACXVFQ_22590 [Solirubrobacteraceae bacterium]